MASLPVRADLEIIVGKTNILLWADADNQEDDTFISARIDWAITGARDYILGLFEDRFHFSTATDLPQACISLIAQQACIDLYRSPRGLIDGDQAFKMITSLMDEVASQVAKYNSGRLKFLDNVTEPKSQPAVNNDTIPGNRKFVKEMLNPHLVLSVNDPEAGFFIPAN